VSTDPSRSEPGPGGPPALIDLEPFDSVAAQWVVAEAEAELVERYGSLAEEELELAGAEFDPPVGSFLVARSVSDRGPIGGVGVRVRGERVGEVKRLWVHPDRRGAGVARALMGQIEEVARQLGHASLRLETGSRQPEAAALYDSLGWVRRDEAWASPSRPGSIRFTKALAAKTPE
jgi:GNAT superfamily N-acetyltransferase